MYLSTDQLSIACPSAPQPLYVVETLHEQGSGEQNEDVLLWSEALFGVFDGATSLDKYCDPDGATGGLCAASIAAETLPETWRKKLPRYPLPVALLGRLAVSRQFQGQGLGSILLADACKRISAASQTLGVAAIVVDAKSAQAATFYQHFGFLALPGQPGRWMLPRSHFVGMV